MFLMQSSQVFQNNPACRVLVKTVSIGAQNSGFLESFSTSLPLAKANRPAKAKQQCSCDALLGRHFLTW